MNELEVSLYTLPPLLAVVAVFLGLALLVGASLMVFFQTAVKAGWTRTPQGFRFNGRLLHLAYEKPKLLRISQSPCWRGALLVALGLCLVHWSVLRVSPAARVAALNHQGVKASAADRLTDERLQEIQADQAPWIQAANQEAVWNPFPAWEPDPRKTEGENWERASRLQTLSRVWEWLGLVLLVAGAIQAAAQAIREGKGKRDHGRAALAARKEVVYDPSGYYSFPLQVSQRGNRDYGAVRTAPYTVARPPASTCVVHTIIYGNSGSGKGAYLGGHIFATSTVPIIYFDYKGEMPAYKLRPGMLRWGFPGERPKGLPSLRFNFLDWVKDHEDPDLAAKALAAAILPAAAQKESENQWIKDTAIPILAQGFLMGRWANLAELADEVEHTPLAELLQLIETGRGRMSAMEGKNVPNYAQNEISNNTQALLTGRARHIVTDSDFTIDEVFTKGLYVMGQASSTYEQRLQKLFWGVLWFELLRKGTKLPLCVFIDEGIAAGPIPRVLEALVTLRDRGVSLIQAFQFKSGVIDVYQKDKAEAVIDGHQTKIYLTKGLSDSDIKQLSENSKSYTVTIKERDERRALIEEAELKAHARQEKFWAVIDGVQWSTSGHPIFASLVPISPDGWNWRATETDYQAELALLGYGVEHRSPFKMEVAGVIERDGKSYRHWQPVYRVEAEAKGVKDKFVLLQKEDDLARTLLPMAAKDTHLDTDAPPPGVEAELPTDFF
jgi:hypothetical protein